MNRDHLLGRLKQFNGKIQEQWCILRNNQIGLIAAKRHQIAGRTQAECGIIRQQAAQQLSAFKSSYRTWRQATSLLPKQHLHHPKKTSRRGAKLVLVS